MTVTPIPQLIPEHEAAAMLGMAVKTLQRKRRAGLIGYTMVCGQKYRYLPHHISDYIARNSVECEGVATTTGKSATIGFPSVQDGHSGTSPTTTAPLGKPSGILLARTILTKRRASLPSGT
ncbi:helix-turn-helix domain-containing protein [Marinivivus vitaminiproducens]|uniref:helix-turn-helix domain-containing protein n=1 Tax=Marinivivus vitaminiproducens TaxID=3035935 RepID=UPI0027A453DC|nr:helix-turn-helix domain-containing protein [Geminicoccaceae bacterium SCSIO 64248]